MAAAIISLERLKALLHYNPDTGIFTRLQPTHRRNSTGVVVGSDNGLGYLTVSLDRVSYRLHRLAWFYMTGEWPEFQIDHKNTIRSDNRWWNLREATTKENTHNQRKAHRHSTTGFLGVRRFRHHVRGPKRYIAVITADGSRKHLGIFDTPELAHAAYVAAKRKLHSSCTL